MTGTASVALVAVSAVIVTPAGSCSAESFTSPPKSLRAMRIIVAMRLPRGTAIACRSCEFGCTAGMLSVSFGCTGVISMR